MSGVQVIDFRVHCLSGCFTFSCEVWSFPQMGNPALCVFTQPKMSRMVCVSLVLCVQLQICRILCVWCMHLFLHVWSCMVVSSFLCCLSLSASARCVSVLCWEGHGILLSLLCEEGCSGNSLFFFLSIHIFSLSLSLSFNQVHFVNYILKKLSEI
jgi:hypothetical protein